MPMYFSFQVSRSARRIPATVVLLFALALPALAQVPAPFAYQGFLTDVNGPVNGSVTLTLRLYDASSTLVWGETHNAVPVADGVYNLRLGSGGVLGGFPPFEQVAFDQAYTLGVQVGSDPEMIPRTPLLGVPYAHSLRGLRVMPVATSGWAPNLVGGIDANTIGPNVRGATLNGGGLNTDPNKVSGDYGTIGGGYGNDAGQHAFVGGGNTNKATAYTSTIGGGQNNTASAAQATVAGGVDNVAGAQYDAIGGGFSNETTGGSGATIGGGINNTATGGSAPTIAGGDNNNTAGSWTSIGGGNANAATTQGATVGGGIGNTAGGVRSTVAGGSDNSANGFYATVPGGIFNVAAADYSFAAGRRAKANHIGSFVWGDATDADFASNNTNQFLVRAGGGMGLGTNAPQAGNGLHIETNDIQLFNTALLGEDLLVEASDAVLGLYSTQGGSWGSAIVLAEHGGFGLVDKWSIARQTTLGNGNSHLYFTFGSGNSYAANTPLMRFDPDGDIHAAGTVTGGGVDLAEAFPVVGPTAAYEPGDVLVIATDRTRTVEKSSRPYSALVAGVYATKPGVLLHEGPIDTILDEKVPMGLIGVIPTKVTGENGPIQVGDLLVTSSTAGHAMKADTAKLGFGMVLGKALEPFDGRGAGVIHVLVNVK